MKTGETKTEVSKAPKRRRTAWWVEILIAIAVVLVVVGIAIPAYNTKKTEARRTEAKQGLHDIQMAVERFATDTESGTYPEYLIGGSATRGDSNNLYEQASDPLIRKGYLTVYPRNPFAVQKTVKAMQVHYKDPFRPGTEQSEFGMRFGEDYKLMGQVLADFRYPKLAGQKMTQANGVYYYADTEYPFWDIWPENIKRPKPFLPGEFFYKSAGHIDFADEMEVTHDRPIVPAYIEIYMLGLYGNCGDTGKDILGRESQITLRFDQGEGKPQREIKIMAWTRSTMKPNDNGDFLGSPYGNEGRNDVIDQLDYVSFNGIPDAIILCVGPGYPE